LAADNPRQDHQLDFRKLASLPGRS